MQTQNDKWWLGPEWEEEGQWGAGPGGVRRDRLRRVLPAHCLMPTPGPPQKSEVVTSDVVLMHRYWALSVGVLVMQQGWVCGESSDGWLIAWDFCII